MEKKTHAQTIIFIIQSENLHPFLLKWWMEQNLKWNTFSHYFKQVFYPFSTLMWPAWQWNQTCFTVLERSKDTFRSTTTVRDLWIRLLKAWEPKHYNKASTLLWWRGGGHVYIPILEVITNFKVYNFWGGYFSQNETHWRACL